MSSSPVVKLSYGSFQGTSSDGLDKFLGIPFAAPPYVSATYHRQRFSRMYMDRTGDLRFGLPKAPIVFKGLRDAISYGAACPQHGVTGPIEQPPPTNTSEDCKLLQI